MGWEYRGHNGPYYTRSRRVGGKVKREYVGPGGHGQMAFAMDADERDERRAKREADRRTMAELAEAEQSLVAFCESADVLRRAVLYASGYRQHKNGEWRYRRGKKTEKTS